MIRGGQLLTLRGPCGPRCGPDLSELNIIDGGSILIRDGLIYQIGPARRIENLTEARNALEINAAGKVVMPSFVDCHTHLAYPPPGVSDADHATAAHVFETAAATRTASRWRVQLESMARHGTTTIGIKTGVGPNIMAEYKVLRILSKLQSEPLEIAATFLLRISSGQGDAENAAFCEFVCREFLPKIRHKKLARFAAVAWDPIAAHHELFRRFLSTASELGFGCKMHAESHAAAAIAMAREFNAVSISHLEQATSSEASLMAGTGMVATLLPSASFQTEAGNAPARALMDAGVPIALGSNFHPTHSPTLNMQTVVALACLRMGLTAAEAISAATINGAYALGCADQTGSLEPGKSADIAILNVSDYRELAHHFGSNLVYATLKRGALIYREAEVGAVRYEQHDEPVLN